MNFSNLKLLVTSGLSNNILEEKLLLREKQDKTLNTDVRNVLSCRTLIKEKTNNTFDNTRILGIVAAAKGAENYLPYTIPKIIKQISEIGMMADIVIGLNNGFECPTVIESLTSLSNVKVIHLYTKEKLASNIPAKIFDNLICAGQPYCLSNSDCLDYQNRIFIVHQKPGLYAAGKIRVLGDIYGSLLLNSINHGWIPPAILFTFDAESQFLVEKNYPFVEPNSNGLKLMVSKLKEYTEIDILSTRNRFAVYQKAILDGTEVLLPNFEEELPPIQFFIDLVHGRYDGYQWMQGGGTFGKTDVLISLLIVISQSYPGIRIEDTHLSILAIYASFICDLFLDVVSTNRTPSPNDVIMDRLPKKAWIEQAFRWLSGACALELCYGEHNIKLIASGKIPLSLFTELIKFLRRVRGRDEINLYTVIRKVKVLATAFYVSQNIKKRSLNKPDILKGKEAIACW